MATILLVEADSDAARRNTETLVRAGFRVDVTTSPAQRPNTAPDVIVLSVPRLDQAVVTDHAFGTVPRVIISSDPADANRAREFGCATVLIRPVMYDQLVTVIRRLAAGALFAAESAPAGAPRHTLRRTAL